ncbi:MAG: formyltransferase family protein, partial [Methanobacteriota archaeon]
MRIICCANNLVGYKILTWLRERNEEIVGLIVHPPEKQKYGEKIIASSGVPSDRIWYGNSLQDLETLNAIRDLKPDMAISLYFGYIFRKPFLDNFPLGCINLHPAYLPYNRGAYPNVWSIIDKTPAGATIHYVNEGVDSGDIISQKKIVTNITDTGETLHHRLESTCVELFKDTWPYILSGAIHPVQQTVHEGTFHKMSDVDKIDEIDLNQIYKAGDLINILRSRTFPPYKGAYIRHNGKIFFITI